MSDAPFSNREISLLFKNIENKLDTLIESVADTNKHFDVRLSKVEEEVDGLKSFQVKAMTLWAVIVTIGGVLLNRII
jgi:hypothetical protein